MKFKLPHMNQQFQSRPAMLLKMCTDFIELSIAFEIEPVVTRVTDTVSGESGVHPQGRAVDFRDEHDTPTGVKRLYTDAQVAAIVEFINKKYKRKDGRLTCLHHKVPGSRAHFHIQMAPREDAYA